MASTVHTSSRAGLAGKSAAGAFGAGRLIGGGAALGMLVAASAWAIASFATMQGMGSPASARFETSLGLKAIDRTAPQMRTVQLAKFSRLPGLKLELDALASAAPVKAVVATAGAKLEVAALTKALTNSMLAAATAEERLKTGSIPATLDGKPGTMATALLEPAKIAPGGLTKPFNLVMTDEDQEAHRGLPGEGPLPLRKPLLPKGLAAKELDASKDDETRGKPKVLAYAKPDIKVFEDDDDDDAVKPSFRGRKGTAYYDISAGVVYMPNGEKLEAHSGIGKMRDNPDFVHVKMKGPTPPGTYKVTMREALFHGVEAVRLTPTNGVAPHGRVGLLAHSYLLRNRGDSHGCVAFANYPKFLKAFKRGEITHMVIVESMKGGFSPAKKTLASLFQRNS